MSSIKSNSTLSSAFKNRITMIACSSSPIISMLMPFNRNSPRYSVVPNGLFGFGIFCQWNRIHISLYSPDNKQTTEMCNQKLRQSRLRFRSEKKKLNWTINKKVAAFFFFWSQCYRESFVRFQVETICFLLFGSSFSFDGMGAVIRT